MSSITAVTGEIQELIEKSFEFEALARSLQDGSLEPSMLDTESLRLQRDYSVWFMRALAIIPVDMRDDFRKEYEGSTFSEKIKKFIFEPLELNPLHDPANPVFPKYTFRVVEAFLRPLEAQRHILGSVLHELAAINPVVSDMQNLVKLFSRFNEFLGAMNSVVPGFEFAVRNESDLQRALTPALRLFARDVRPEDFVPDFGGSRSRTDFFLPDSGIAVETKMTRESLRAGKLRDEIIIDFRQYLTFAS